MMVCLNSGKLSFPSLSTSVARMKPVHSLTCQIPKLFLRRMRIKKLRFKGTVQPDWICMRMLSLDRHKKSFWFYHFSFEYLNRLQSSEPLHTKMNPTSCLFESRFVWAQTAIFSAEPCSKNVEESTKVLWIMARE